MKKKLFIISLFLFIIFSFTNVNALSFTAPDGEHQVTDVETLRDYCYFKYKYNDNNDVMTYLFVSSNDSNYYYCAFAYFDSSYDASFFENTSNRSQIKCAYNNHQTQCINIRYVSFNISDFSFKSTYLTNYFIFNTNKRIYSTDDIYTDLNFTDISFHKNLSLSDIENKYVAITPEPSNNESTSSLDISKEEFYLIPFVCCIIFWSLFLKWCFPNKGGKKI